MNTSYNYVIFDDNEDSFYKDTLSDLSGLENVRVINPPLSNENKILRTIYKIHVSERVAKIINLPFKKIWKKKLFKNDFKNNKPICFMFCNSLYKLRWTGFFEYLKEEYPDCKLVYYCRDLFKYCFARYKKFDQNYLKKTFDYILTYDLRDSIEYGLTFYSDFESIHKDKFNYNFENKVLFIGAARNRLDKILEAFWLFKNNGIRCDFYITGVPAKKRFYDNEIVFADRWLNYDKVLEKISSSSCVLEIIQEDSYGYSARAMKAIGYNKKLVTNAVAIKYTRFFKDNKICFFNSVKDIDLNYVKFGDMPFYNYKEEFSPKSIVLYLDYLFNGGTTQNYYSSWFDLASFKDAIVKEIFK